MIASVESFCPVHLHNQHVCCATTGSRAPDMQLVVLSSHKRQAARDLMRRHTTVVEMRAMFQASALRSPNHDQFWVSGIQLPRFCMLPLLQESWRSILSLKRFERSQVLEASQCERSKQEYQKCWKTRSSSSTSGRRRSVTWNLQGYNSAS